VQPSLLFSAPVLAPRARRAKLVSAMGLARLMARRRHVVVAQWKELVCSLSDAGRLAEPHLVDHLPELLDWLADRLESPCHTDDSGGWEFSHRHAQQRSEQDFDLMEVLAEFAILKDVLLGVWQEAPEEVRPSEVRQLCQDLDEVAIICVTDFARARLDRGRQDAHPSAH
jgi:hypothetical protein